VIAASRPSPTLGTPPVGDRQLGLNTRPLQCRQISAKSQCLFVNGGSPRRV
jgi:hypothetical protein